MTRPLLPLLLLGCAEPLSPLPGGDGFTSPPPQPGLAVLTGPEEATDGETVFFRVELPSGPTSPGDLVELRYGTTEGPGVCPFSAQTGGAPCMDIMGRLRSLGTAYTYDDGGVMAADFEVSVDLREPFVYVQAFVLHGRSSATSNVLPLPVAHPSADLADLQALVAAQQDALVAQQAVIDQLTADLMTLQGETAAIPGLQSAITTLQGETSALPGMQANISMLQGETAAIPGLQSAITTLQGETSALPGMQANISMLQGETAAIPGLQSAITTLQGETSALPGMQANISMLQGETAAIPGLQSAITTLQGETSALAGMQSAITTLQGETSALPGMQSAIDAAEADLAGLQAQLDDMGESMTVDGPLRVGNSIYNVYSGPLPNDGTSVSFLDAHYKTSIGCHSEAMWTVEFRGHNYFATKSIHAVGTGYAYTPVGLFNVKNHDYVNATSALTTYCTSDDYVAFKLFSNAGWHASDLTINFIGGDSGSAALGAALMSITQATMSATNL
jgi:environmental stress-induced protein Ves